MSKTDRVKKEIFDLTSTIYDPKLDWNGFNSVKNSELRLDEQLRYMIRKYGHYISLRKTVPGRCECVLEFAGSPDPNCRLCNGEGKRFIDHLVLARKYIYGPEIGAEQRTPLGIIHNRVPVFIIEPFLSSKDTPTTDDYVAELVLDYDLRTPIRPYKITILYKISDVSLMRDIRGDIAFYQLRCEEKTWERK